MVRPFGYRVAQPAKAIHHLGTTVDSFPRPYPHCIQDPDNSTGNRPAGARFYPQSVGSGRTTRPPNTFTAAPNESTMASVGSGKSKTRRDVLDLSRAQEPPAQPVAGAVSAPLFRVIA